MKIAVLLAASGLATILTGPLRGIGYWSGHRGRYRHEKDIAVPLVRPRRGSGAGSFAAELNHLLSSRMWRSANAERSY